MDNSHNAFKPVRVLYLFAGERKKLEREWRAGRMPDSQFIGFNHLKNYGIEASYLENRFLNFIRKRNFNFTNLLLLLTVRRYDAVFSGASLALPFVARVLLRFKRPKFIWYNTFFTNALKRNKGNRLRLWAFRKTIASLDAVVCPSNAQRDFLIRQGFDPARIFYVPNGVDVDFVERQVKSPAAALCAAAGPFILSVGKDMGRDYQTLTEAVSGLPVKVKVAALPRNFREVKAVPPNLEILGFVSFSRLLELYQEALFVVIPTKSERHLDASDCSGQYVLLDAMSAGKAVIASRRETLADYFEDRSDGIVVPPEDAAALRAAAAKLLAYPKLAAQMGARGREKTASFFTTKRLAEDLAKIFKNLAD